MHVTTVHSSTKKCDVFGISPLCFGIRLYNTSQSSLLSDQWIGQMARNLLACSLYPSSSHLHFLFNRTSFGQLPLSVAPSGWIGCISCSKSWDHPCPSLTCAKLCTSGRPGQRCMELCMNNKPPEGFAQLQGGPTSLRMWGQNRACVPHEVPSILSTKWSLCRPRAKYIQYIAVGCCDCWPSPPKFSPGQPEAVSTQSPDEFLLLISSPTSPQIGLLPLLLSSPIRKHVPVIVGHHRDLKPQKSRPIFPTDSHHPTEGRQA